MEFQKTINSLDMTSNDKDLLKNRSKFLINKKKSYSINKKIKINAPILRSDSRDFINLSIKHNSIV